MSEREEASRYPVFLYGDYGNYDESDLFKDEGLKGSSRRNVFAPNLTQSQKRKNQTIVTIYDKINANNASDPLYPKPNRISYEQKLHMHKHVERNQKFTTISSARGEQHKLHKSNKYERSISKLVGQLTSSLESGEIMKDVHRTQKISLLKRIIEHYNIKSVEKNYYSSLIKSFGLKIEALNQEELATKKPLTQEKKKAVPKQFTQSYEKIFVSSTFEAQEEKSKKQQTKRRRFKPCLSFMTSKDSPPVIPEYLKKERSPSQKQKKRELPKNFQFSQKLVQKPLRIQNSSSSNIHNKVAKYREFLFLINYSNYIYQNLDFEKYQTTFKFYVGKGNNGNLIKSLMKKRFWFERTENIEQANFIWTQIKKEKLYEKQKPSQRYETLQKKIIEQQLTRNQQKAEREIKKPPLTGFSHISRHDKKLTIKPIRFAKNQSSVKHYQPSDPLQKILTTKEIKQYKEIEDSLGYNKKEEFMRKVKVSRRALKIDEEEKRIHNHLPFNGLLGNKKALYYNLKHFCFLTNTKLSQYIPLTFHIKKGLGDEEYKNFSAMFMQRKKSKQSNYWIMKPGQFSNRGQGIACTNKLEDVRKRLLGLKSGGKGKSTSLILQMYISNPLLYNYRKFDIRAFMMVTSYNGKIKGYWYQEGYIRTSSFVWNLSDIDDKYIHLTNDAIQKNCEEYGMYQPGNKLSYHELQRYLQTLPSCGRNLDFFALIYPKMRAIATDAIRSVFMGLDPNRLRDNFELFGLDFMLDTHFKPWLIEINTNPCLQINCQLLSRIIPHMLENVFRIAVDPLFPPPSSIHTEYKYAIPENALHYNKFQLVFDEDRDGPQLQNLYQNHSIIQQLHDFEEDKEEFEEEGDQIDYQV